MTMTRTRACAALVFGLIVSALVLGPSHAAPATVASPSFVAIGGGLKDDNKAVFDALLTRNDTKKIVIVPFASADPAEAARRAAEQFRAHRPDARILTLPDPLDGPEASKLAADWIAHADLVYFTGGDQSRLTPRFLDERGPNAVLRALQDGQLRFDTRVGGTSAGCAALSDPMFTGGGSESALANLPAADDEPGDPGAAPAHGVRLGRGLGLLRGVILDSHFLERGRYGRMVAALEASTLRFGVGVAENRALDIGAGAAVAIGDHAALVVDVKDLARDGLSRRGVRISLLSDGDRFTLSPQPGTPHIAHAGKTIDRLPTPPPDEPTTGAWSKGTLVVLLTRLAADPSSTQRARSDRFEVALRADARTIFAWREGDAATLRVIDALLDIIERPIDPTAAP